MALVIEKVDFCPKENAQEHHTAKYDVVNDMGSETTVVRRGQPFKGVIHFDRHYDSNDLVQFVFSLGKKLDMETRGSIYLRQDALPNKKLWIANITSIQQNTLQFEVTSPVTLPVGVWALTIKTALKHSPKKHIYHFDKDIYILFNPWNPDDQTYMEDSRLLKEYVLSDVGKIWMGPVNSGRGKPWCYGQFDAAVLPACMFMLKRAKLPYNQRGDPIKLTRAISRIVNSNDDEGVLIGRWYEPYTNGTAPWDWTGSVDILSEYLNTKQSVSYGQCWVFAGVVTTVCRALGIPCRTVTNVVSAHDSNNTLSVDLYYSEDGTELDYDPTSSRDQQDMIWNYHAWNDAWMARPDLPLGYGGWQAIDATPQETSQGLYQCGPASLEAIKQGATGLGYDVEFILAAVNADLMRWREDPDAEEGYSVVDTHNYHIGRMVITKKPFIFHPNDDGDCEDITNQYKYREGTTSERLALMNGVHFSERAKRYYGVVGSSSSDVKFKLRDIDTVSIGKDFEVVVDIQNTSDKGRKIKATLSATSVYYNGIKANLVKSVENDIYVGPQKQELLRLTVKADEYLPKLVEYCNMKISAMAIIEDTKQSWADDDDFQIVRPNINIAVQDDVIQNEPVNLILSLKNPLSRPLTGCEFVLTSPKILGKTLRFQTEDVQPGETINIQVTVQPNKPGKIKIVATFKSLELKDISGAAIIQLPKVYFH